MKKAVSFVLCLCFLFVFAGCNESANTDDNTTNIGVIQLAEHPALDQSYEGFMQALKDAGVDAQIEMKNAQGDPSNCETIVTKFVNDQVDLILAIATNAAQAAANATETIPVVLTAVTDPEFSGLVDSNEHPGHNVTGTSDLTPVEAQIDLLREILPDAQNVAILFNGAEDNSIFQADMAEKAINAKGMKTEKVSVSELNQIQSIVESLVGKVDAIYIPTDNLLAEGMATVSMITNENKIPVIVGEEGMVTNGGLATYGLSYFNLGYKAGEMAVEILNGANPAEMAIGYLPAEDCELIINMETVKELGLTIPDTVLNRARKINE